jgi:hypothetical protein
MTLKEKFLQLAFAKISSEELRDKSAKLAEDFAIEFAEWINRVSYRSVDNNWYLTQDDEDIKKTTEELLEIYKKEKGL